MSRFDNAETFLASLGREDFVIYALLAKVRLANLKKLPCYPPIPFGDETGRTAKFRHQLTLIKQGPF